LKRRPDFYRFYKDGSFEILIQNSVPWTHVLILIRGGVEGAAGSTCKRRFLLNSIGRAEPVVLSKSSSKSKSLGLWRLCEARGTGKEPGVLPPF
jgi:hypothetical protein